MGDQAPARRCPPLPRLFAIVTHLIDRQDVARIHAAGAGRGAGSEGEAKAVIERVVETGRVGRSSKHRPHAQTGLRQAEKKSAKATE